MPGTSLGYWHMIPGAPEGSLEQRATALLKLWRDDKIAMLVSCGGNQPENRTADEARDVARAMALELAVAATSIGGGFPRAVVDLVLETLPQWAFVLIDPAEVYSGRQAGRGKRPTVSRMRLRSLCQQLDVEFAEKNHRIESAETLALRLIELVRADQSLARGVSEEWSDAPNLARSVRRWRKDYAAELEVATGYRT